MADDSPRLNEPSRVDGLRRAVVTGIGLATPLGRDRESSWNALLAGESGVREGRGECPLSPSSAPRAVQLALAAAREATADASSEDTPLGERWGCSVSCSKPMLTRSAEGRPWSFERPGVVPATLAARFGVAGPVLNLASACATGLHSAMIAAEWIREGRCDAVLAGASESSLHPLYVSGFHQMGVLSRKGRVRPFDRDRDGFVIGEGAAVFVIEERERARLRGARIYGELLGWDFSCDGSHATRFNSHGQRISRSLERALSRANFSPQDVGYLNAHGTATVLNDDLETQALSRVFHRSSPLISSTKGATGHLLGATGAVELAFCLLALRDKKAPPTLNLSNPIADFDFVSGKPRRLESDCAATVSFGFGGALGSLVLGR
jgi:3-oxoacyl-[acyl-carrier-protein] synthase II